MFAILNNTEDADWPDESPVFKIFSQEQKSQRKKWEMEIARLGKSSKLQRQLWWQHRPSGKSSLPPILSGTSPSLLK
jgi:hypothetical protein